MNTALQQTDLEGLTLLKQGKVRDIYEVDGQLLIVASDRVSAFDVVMDDPIPDKGKVLTQISLFWFRRLGDIISNHLISANPEDYPAVCWPYADILRGRSMLVKKAKPLPVECIARGYLSGSGWKEYRAKQSVCDILLPPDLLESDQLLHPIFTPSTKAEQGLHDENISFERAAEILGEKIAAAVKNISLLLYKKAAWYAEQCGIIIADTKFEFGLDEEDNLILIDEVLTPDSSRFWPVDSYKPGGPQKSFDKQYLRDYLEGLVQAGEWNKEPPPPKLPAQVITNTRSKYLEAARRLII